VADRDEFEAYARRAGYDIRRPVVNDNHAYLSSNTSEAWNFWQASRRSMPEPRFASWCADLLTSAESKGLYLDEDKREILSRARALIGGVASAGGDR